MAFTSILAIQNRNGTQQSATRVIPGNVNNARLRLDRDAGDRWQAGQSVALRVDASFDGGTTWQPAASSAFDGPLPQFARDGVTPYTGPYLGVSVPVQADGTRAGHVRAGYTVTGGPVRFGVSVEVV